MALRNQHRILRQVLEIDLETSVGAPQIQDELAHPFRSGQLPALETLFDRISGPDQLLCLERVEVDLGTMTGNDWYDQFFERLVIQLRHALENIDGSDVTDSASKGPSRSEQAVTPFRQLLFYLVKGRLPWWGGAPSSSTWIADQADALNTAQWQSLRDVVQSSSNAKRRLVQAVGDDFLEVALKAWLSLSDTVQVLDLLSPPDVSHSDRQRWRGHFWNTLLDHGLTQSIDGPRLVHNLITVRPSLPSDAPKERSTSANTTANRLSVHPLKTAVVSLPQPWKAWAETVLDDRHATQSSSGSAEFDAGMSKGVASNELDDRKRDGADDFAGTANFKESGSFECGDDDDPQSSRLDPQRRSVADARLPSAKDRLKRRDDGGSMSEFDPALDLTEDECTAIYVGGAGAIIVHPFLEALFNSRHLLHEGDFVDEMTRQKAVYMLAYLTHGTGSKPEYELLLAKLLCNMAWEEPLPDCELDSDEMDACNELLQTLLGHWKALKSSSIAWMREQFFLRDGKLERVDYGWKLTVERQAQDVLLAKLPWGVGLIRLPWLPYHLHVNWTD